VLGSWAESLSGRAGKIDRRRLRFAFYGQVSTEDWQDPVTSRARQVQQAAMLAAGHGTIVAEHYGITLWMPEVGGRVGWQGSGSRGRAPMTGPADAGALIDQLLAHSVALTYDPDDRTSRTVVGPDIDLLAGARHEQMLRATGTCRAAAWFGREGRSSRALGNLITSQAGVVTRRLAAQSGRCGVTHRATVVFVALAAVDTLLAATGCDRLRWLTKPALMPVLMRGRDRPVQRALALGGAGDVALLGRSEVTFRAGLACFLAGHVAWIMALRERPGGGLLRAKPALAAPYLAAFGAVNAYLWKRTGKDRIPVVVYSTALLAMALAALDSGSPRTAAGGALFLASDALIALEKFGGLHLPAHEGVVMAAYTSAQALLAG
jgi:uncharacterized membrane protein YhhN